MRLHSLLPRVSLLQLLRPDAHNLFLVRACPPVVRQKPVRGASPEHCSLAFALPMHAVEDWTIIGIVSKFPFVTLRHSLFCFPPHRIIHGRTRESLFRPSPAPFAKTGRRTDSCRCISC